ncbi:MAG: 3-hydroxy-9,10-secoandrosta,3,5(10)-triene-9,17-dione monooxygenase [Ilumatobacteraceae bacterium]|nr:3-hydroxy-9,10-secoandrosta,3,5(10)-triene-9,17-dione monooxygenase [Ilumatobacteraceae bacterium]
MSTTMPITAADAVARARELTPELRERAAQTALDRRIPQINIDALRRAGALKTIQATRNGGYALGIRSHLDVMSALGRGCGSTAWVAGVVQAHSWLMSHFPEQGQDDVYGGNADAIVSAVIGPRGKAVRTSDGYRLEGVWPFGSGSERADWLLLGGIVFDDDGNELDQGDFIVPASAVTIKDDWYVSGLSGTGSCTMVLEPLEIPAHRFLSLPGLIMGNSPGGGLHGDDWVQRSAPVPVLTIALCGGAIGIAKQALADFPAAIKGKTIAYTADPQEPHAFTHIRLGDAASRIREGELLLYAVADELDATARAGGEVPFLRRAEMRNDCATAVRRLLEGVEILFRESGATGVRTSSPINRALADIQTINNHGLMKLETNQEMYGRLLLGLEPNTPLI